MGCRRKSLGWLLVAWCAAANAALAQTMPNGTPSVPAPRPASPSPGFVTHGIPLEELPPPLRERVRSVLEHPTLSSRGPLEAFHCRPPLYYWLLDHPDLAVRLWRGLGAKCTDIQSGGDGSFTWKEAQNGEVHWQTVLRTPRQRIWYAEGKVRPSVMLPSIPVRAVVVLYHQEGADSGGKPAVRHQMDLILHTDSRAVNLVTRLFGASAPRMAEEYVGQMQMFFGALAWYLTQHPDKATALFEDLKRTAGSSVPRGAATPAAGPVRSARPRVKLPPHPRPLSPEHRGEGRTWRRAMTPTLPAPEVVRCYFDTTFEPHLPAMCLRWDRDDPEQADHVWELPEGVRFSGPPPRHFGIRIQRQAADSYAVRLLWERTCLTWLDLTRDQLLGSDLDPLLASLGTDLWYLLDQPLLYRERTPPHAA